MHAAWLAPLLLLQVTQAFQLAHTNMRKHLHTYGRLPSKPFRPRALACTAEPTLDPQTPQGRRYAYLHGFLSTPNSFKGLFLKDSLQAAGVELSLLDLNAGHPSRISYAGALAAVCEWDAAASSVTQSIGLVGSSFGGYIAAQYCASRPQSASPVDRLLLLCPAFDMANRWKTLYGAHDLSIWKSQGVRSFNLNGEQVDIPYAFVAEGLSQQQYPNFGAVPCVIVQGTRDTVVPPETIENMFNMYPSLRETTVVYYVDDDHALTSEPTLQLLDGLAQTFLSSNEARGKQNQSRGVQNIEVEKKYAAPENLESFIKTVESVSNSSNRVTMYDSYWDTPENDLIKHDFWLRRRGGIWELKKPVSRLQGGSVYEEVTEPRAISASLSELLADSSDSATPHELDVWLNRFGLTRFASIYTDRSSFILEKYGVQVDVDMAWFPSAVQASSTLNKWNPRHICAEYSLIEIEALQCTGSVEEASRRIDDVAMLLGLRSDPNNRIPSKVEICLKNYHATLLELLRSQRR